MDWAINVVRIGDEDGRGVIKQCWDDSAVAEDKRWCCIQSLNRVLAFNSLSSIVQPSQVSLGRSVCSTRTDMEDWTRDGTWQTAPTILRHWRTLIDIGLCYPLYQWVCVCVCLWVSRFDSPVSVGLCYCFKAPPALSMSVASIVDVEARRSKKHIAATVISCR